MWQIKELNNNAIKEKEVIWEEKNSIEPEKNCSPQPISVPSDTTTKIKNELTPKQCVNIIQIKSGIYKIRNKINGKYYIGSAKNINYRWITHRKLLKSNKHFNRHLQSSWNKHGKENFDWVIVKQFPNTITKNELLLAEQKYLDIVKTERNKSYNLNFNSSGGELSDESKKKISDKLSLKISK